ncbi:hypothetical protein [Azospirillum brasilense]|uniref:hypothetical protein n=1 Tax=Azospirillum brasilense TaxID=192 RepID=UPI0011EEEC09|nr:hypothetical protein [Azospirillum brasilense]
MLELLKRGLVWSINIICVIAVVVAIAMLFLLLDARGAFSQTVPTSSYWIPFLNAWLDSTTGIKGTPRTSGEYLSAIDQLLNVCFAVITVAGIILTVFGVIRVRKPENSGISLVPLYFWRNEIKLMASYYKGARSVRVYSGDFSWLMKNDSISWIDRAYNFVSGANIQKTTREFCRKGAINFVSYKAENQVREALGQLFSDYSASFAYSSSLRAHFSFIEYPEHRVFLYLIKGRQNPNASSAPPRRMLIIRETDETRTLFQVLQQVK